MSIFTSLRRWWNNQDEIDSRIFAHQDLSKILDLVRQDRVKMEFLLANGTLMDAPEDIRRAGSAVAPYAYIHPETLKNITGWATNFVRATHEPWVFISHSPTRWVSTELMPEGRVIYSPNAMPGLPGGNYVQKVFAGKR